VLEERPLLVALVVYQVDDGLKVAARKNIFAAKIHGHQH
jgi:hypothetical protein